MLSINYLLIIITREKEGIAESVIKGFHGIIFGSSPSGFKKGLNTKLTDLVLYRVSKSSYDGQEVSYFYYSGPWKDYKPVAKGEDTLTPHIGNVKCFAMLIYQDISGEGEICLGLVID